MPIKNNNPEVCSCKQGQQGLTLANIGINFYFCKKDFTFKEHELVENSVCSIWELTASDENCLKQLFEECKQYFSGNIALNLQRLFHGS